MTDHTSHMRVSQSLYQSRSISNELQHVAGLPVAVKALVSSCGAAIAALIGGYHVVTRRRQDRQLMTPTEGQFGETVQQQQQGFVSHCAAMSGFEHMHVQAGGDGDVARTYALGQGQGCK